MSWEMVRFGDLYGEPSRNGISVSSKNQHDGSTNIVNMGELFESDYVGDSEMRRIKVDETELHRFCLAEGDLLFARRSLVASGAGKAALVSRIKEPTVFESSIIRVRLNRERACPRFYLYWLKSFAGRDTVSRLVTGTNVKGIRGSELSEVKVPLPSLNEQMRIADILSAYDKLIENCRRQIALLEEAAQRLYKEWFVDLRFPGHETTPIIDGLPKEWRKGKLGDIVEFRRGKTITQNETLDGDVPVVAGGLEPAYYHAHANTTSPVITVSGSGANAGFCKLYTTEVWASDCSFADSSMTDNLFFVYVSVKVLSNGFKQCQRGSAQPHVYPKHVNALDVTIPDGIFLSAFNNAAKALYSQIGTLNKWISAAREARDRLLPKLMSGEIEVV